MKCRFKGEIQEFGDTHLYQKKDEPFEIPDEEARHLIAIGVMEEDKKIEKKIVKNGGENV